MIEAIKTLADSGISIFCKNQTTTVLIENFVDFLYRLKDRHPYSTFVFINMRNSEINKNMDLLYTIMEFLIPNGYLPSASLLKEYSGSKVTKELNILPTLEYLNSKFKEKKQMNEEDYERLRKRFESRPPFIFYFNPSIELQEKVWDDCRLMKGFFAEGTDVSVNKSNSCKFK